MLGHHKTAFLRALEGCSDLTCPLTSRINKEPQRHSFQASAGIQTDKFSSYLDTYDPSEPKWFEYCRWLCRQLKRYSHMTSKHPAIRLSHHQTRQYYNEDERRECSEIISQETAWSTILLISISLWYGFKCWFAAGYTLATVDLVNIELNLHTFNHNSFELTQFSCILTNCSRLLPIDDDPTGEGSGSSGSQRLILAQELSRLPLMRICKPHLAPFFDTVDYADGAALYSRCILGYSAILLGAFIPIWIWSSGIFADAILFPLTPNTVMLEVRARVVEYLQDLTLSHRNYLNVRSTVPSGICNTRCWWPSRTIERNTSILLPSTDTNQQLDQQLPSERYIADCFPVIRTKWWRRWSAVYFSLIYLIISISCSLAHLATWLYFNYLCEKKDSLLKLMASSARHQGCLFWAMRDSSSKLEQIELDTFLANNDASAFLELNLVFNLIFYATANINIAYFIVFNFEIWYWLDELIHQARVLVEYSKYLANKWPARFSSGPIYGPTRIMVAKQLERQSPTDSIVGSVGLRVRERFLRLLGSNPFVLISKHRLTADDGYYGLGRTMATSLEAQHFVIAQILEVTDDEANPTWNELDHWLSIYSELMEKSYVNLRLFNQSFDANQKSVGAILLFAYAVTYGTTAVSVFVNAAWPGYTYISNLLVTCGVIIASAIILVASVMSTKGKTYLRLIWTIVGLTADLDDSRVSHIRLLWMRQLTFMQIDGGPAFQTIGIRVTYVNLIQVTVVTLTILLFVYRQH